MDESPPTAVPPPAPDAAHPGTRTDRTRPFLERLTRFADTTDGTAARDGITTMDPVDRVAAFGPAILAIRWATTIVSLGLTIERGHADSVVTGWCVALIVYTVLRTMQPIRYLGTNRSLVEVLGEVTVGVAALSTTGGWESPLIFSLMTAVIVAGFSRGFGFAMRVAIVSSFAVSYLYLYANTSDATIQIAAQWSLVLLLVAVVAGYARRISGEADRQHSLALTRLGRLADANALLFSLHRVTQTLPASLDMDDVLDTTIGRMRGLFDFDSAAVLALDDTDASWEVLRRENIRLPAKLHRRDLPPPLRAAIAGETVIALPDLLASGGPGLSPKAGSGLYAVLAARGAIIGLLAVEHPARRHFTTRDLELLKGFVEPVALAIDNARWFGRLRTVGADEERTRIARDLHDRIGQSLAYLAFELDRIVACEGRGDPVGPSLDQLRDDVRSVIREVRDTLYDLRTDVSDTQDMAGTLETYVARVGDRSGLQVELFCDRGKRLPILQEREMWRIAQEALTNIERHAHATRARILWRCNGTSAALEITDDGRGFPIGKAGRLDSYGILGMRERASSIGATLDLSSEVGKGTRVRVNLVGSGEGEVSSSSPKAMTGA